MKRLLCIVGSMNAGGAETFLMKLYRSIDRSKYQLDFAVTADGVYDAEIKALGGKVHFITPKSKGFWKNVSDIYKLVKKEEYKYVLRSSQHSLSALELLVAWIAGAKTRVFRSSNTNACAGKANACLHTICGFMPRWFANVKIAPSTEAAQFMFGKNSVKAGNASVLHNALDFDLFKYTDETRQKLRDELGLKDKLAIGHIGRFNHQKNHKFLLEIFEQIVKMHPNSVLLLVGKGELKDEIEKLAAEKCLASNIKFLGVRSDVNELLSAIDLMIFPSYFEGMPNTVIEAQAAGLPCLISDKITPEAKITPLVKYLSLETSPKEWAREGLDMVSADRLNTYSYFKENGYFITDVSNQFCKRVFYHERF